MNREQRRRMLKISSYRNVLKSTTKKIIEDLEIMLKQNWNKNKEKQDDAQKDHPN